MSLPIHSSQQRKQFQQQVLGWYHKHQRQLPWRESGDPYRIWISEIMLQQTTIAAVVPYFERFLNSFPDLRALAAAEEADVLKHWEGLGYYSRARNIHKAAQLLWTEHQGKFPEDVDQLQKLPGVGKYTAHAIASFAFGQSVPILEANTQRLNARLLGWTEEIGRTASQKRLWEFADELVPAQQAGHFNQALMDIGSTICTPQQPHCQVCPISEFCVARQQAKQHDIPVLPLKSRPIEVIHFCLLIERNNSGKPSYLMRQYLAGERWAGLWDFPRWETQLEIDRTFPQPWLSIQKSHHPVLFRPEEQEQSWRKKIAAEFSERFGVSIQLQQHIKSIVHTVTRYRITLICFHATIRARQLKITHPQQWTSVVKLEELALSTTGRKLADLLMNSGKQTGGTF